MKLETFVRGRAHRSASFACALLFITCATFFTGCSILPEAAADPTRYYVLSSPNAKTAPAPAPDATAAVLGIRGIDLPSYLRASKSMVIRRGPNEVRYEDFARWAEPLETGLGRVLKDRLSTASKVKSVAVSPFMSDEARDFDVRIRLTACEGNAPTSGNPSVLFSAVYEVVRVKERPGELVIRRTFSAPATAWNGQDFGDLARALSEAAVQLATDIEENLPTP